jgi:2-methylisocitrate lyase-like PEP mutase family enzyme
MIKDKGADRLFLEALMERDKFEKMAEHLDDYLQAQQELPDMRADLDAFCEKIEGEKTAAD